PPLPTATLFPYTTLFRSARLLLSETLFTFLFLAAVVALVTHARRGGRAPLIAAGAALGLAILTRGIALGFLAAMPLWLALVHGADRKSTRLNSSHQIISY